MTKSDFDTLIKDNLQESGIDENGFGYQGTYENYYSEKEFNQFVAKMAEDNPQAYASYMSGKGSELKPKDGKPPKMASVASSSRFCYLALGKGAEALGGIGEVQFERACKIDGILGTPPQLDGFVKSEEEPIFIEVKCQEIFTKHKAELKAQYWDYIHGKESQFGLSSEENHYEEKFTVPLNLFGIYKENTMFDIPQLLHHLLGISCDCKKTEKKKLVYLFFKPIASDLERQKNIDEIFGELEKEISAIFESVPINEFCSANEITLLAVAEESKVMEPLTKKNMKYLYPKE